MEGEGEEPVMSQIAQLIVPLLGVVLVILKVLGIISLAWVWVLAPFWIPLVLFVLVGIPFIIIALAVAAFASQNTATRATDITNLNRLKRNFN